MLQHFYRCRLFYHKVLSNLGRLYIQFTGYTLYFKAFTLPYIQSVEFVPFRRSKTLRALRSSFFKSFKSQFSFPFFKQTELKSGDLNAVPKGAHELWSDLKDALIKRPVLLGCYDPRRQVICNCCETEGQHKCDDSHKDNLSRVDPVAKRDTAR